MAVGQGRPHPAGGVTFGLRVRHDWHDEGDQEALDVSLRCQGEKEIVEGLFSLWWDLGAIWPLT